MLTPSPCKITSGRLFRPSRRKTLNTLRALYQALKARRAGGRAGGPAALSGGRAQAAAGAVGVLAAGRAGPPGDPRTLLRDRVRGLPQPGVLLPVRRQQLAEVGRPEVLCY